MNGTAPQVEAEGNGTVLLVVDSRAADDYAVVGEAMLAALQHLGIPYRTHDLSGGIFPAEQLLGHRCIILGQDGLGKQLSQTGAEALRDAVKAGVGLVSFDGRLGEYHSTFAEILDISPARAPVLCMDVKTNNVDHYITATRELSDDLKLTTPVEVWPIESPRHGLPGAGLLQTSSNWPLLITNTFGTGRAVAFTFSAKLWTREVLGHASGLDDVFWKSIIWAARKPFAIYAMPPFATALVDDCSGSYNQFRYVDTMNEYGWTPHLELYLEDIDRVMHHEEYAEAAKIKHLHDYGLATFGVHGFTYNDLMWFDHGGRKPLSDEQLAENFRRYDEYLKQWGIKASRYENFHFSEMGSNALPHLKERGIEFLSQCLNLDTAWFDVPDRKPAFIPPGPYHHRGYYMAHMSEDPDFFILRSKLEPWSFDTTDAAPQVDFLWDRTIFWDESPFNDVAAAIRIGIKQVRRGVDARFFGTLLCHEQRVAVVPMYEWDEMLAGIRDGLRKYELIYRSIEYIADYARSRHDTHIATVAVDDDSGQVHCQLRGKTTVTTALETYTNQGAGVARRYCDIPPFSGTATVKT